MLSEAMDEKFASLEERLTKEFTDIKWLLYSILEQRRIFQTNFSKNVRNANLHGASDDYLSSRQDEIDKFNDTVQNLSVSNG